METQHSLEDIRKKAHSINCSLSDEGYTAREIEIVGYYLNRIAASYLSFFTHKEYEKNLDPEEIEEAKEDFTFVP